MKKLTRNSLFIGMTSLIFSCEPQSFIVENPEQYSNVFMQSASETSVARAFDIEDHWHEIPFGAGYGGFDELKEDLIVTFEVRDDLVAEFNALNGTNYQIAPTDSYRIPQTSVIIPAGRTGSNSVNLEVNPLHLGGLRPVLLPISIRSVSGSVNIEESLRTTYYLLSGSYITNPYSPIPKNSWTIHDVSSEEDVNTEGPAWKAIDGDVNTHWLSKWRRDAANWRPQHPHYIAIDMGESHTLHGLQIFGRVGTNANNVTHNFYLFPRLVNIEISEDGTNWESVGIYSTALEPAQFPEFTIYFEQSAVGRYFRITVTNSHHTGDTTALAEIEAF